MEYDLNFKNKTYNVHITNLDGNGLVRYTKAYAYDEIDLCWSEDTPLHPDKVQKPSAKDWAKGEDCM